MCGLLLQDFILTLSWQGSSLFYDLEITFFQEMAELKAFVLFIYLFNQKTIKPLFVKPANKRD
jgi:hypothetical protein